ncbi:MAG TPA: GNAT family N-acetyltransferase [Ktedonobacterales bacterium]|nr:GNAT family N-acetyltransferase [Ktedonobacterales bacterium]
MDTSEIVRRILVQRSERYTDPGPILDPAGTARFRMDGSRLRVAYATAHPGQAGELVRAVLRFARSRKLQVQWSIVPSRPGEEELGAALLAARFEMIENLLLMVRRGRLAIAVNQRVQVTHITTWQAMLSYEYGSRRSFYDDPHPLDALVVQRATDRWRERERGWCRYYAAYYEGAQVGGCYVSLWEEVPTIMGVYTLPEARQRGVATALLARSITESIRPEQNVVCLYVEHGNPAERLYRALGFESLIDTQTFTWRAA